MESLGRKKISFHAHFCLMHVAHPDSRSIISWGDNSQVYWHHKRGINLCLSHGPRSLHLRHPNEPGIRAKAVPLGAHIWATPECEGAHIPRDKSW